MPRSRIMALVVLLSLVALTSQSLLAQGDPWTILDNPGPADPPAEPRGVPTADIIFTPDSAAHSLCPPFAACPPGSQITDEYIDFGVDFTVFNGNPPVGVFIDPPEKFAGVNGSGDLDLVTDSCGRIVVPGSQSQATTDLIIIEAGNVLGPNDILLEVYDAGGTVIGSSIADDGTGEDGDLVAVVQVDGQTIASFCVITPTNDTYGLRRIHLNDPGVGVQTMSPAAILGLALLMAVVGSLFLRQGKQTA